MSRFGWSLSLALVVLMVIFWLANSERLATWLRGESVVSVRVAAVKTRAVPINVRINGVVAPAKAVDVISQLAGKITEVRFKVGDAVPAGAVVATIFPSEIAQRETDLSTGLAAARKDLQTKENQLADAEKLAARTRELFAQDLIARRDMDKAESAAQTARAQAELARANLAQQEAMLAQAKKIGQMRQIIAPLGGIIARRLGEPGATVAPGNTILSIVGDNTLKFTGRVVEQIAGKLRVGLNALVSAAGLPEAKLDGSLTGLQPTRDNGAAVVEVEIQINDGPTIIRVATPADALVQLGQTEEVLLVPRVALSESGGKSYLFKFADSRAVQQEVKLGAVEGDDVVIEQGISPTDMVILDNLQSLKPGVKVRALSTMPALAR